MPVRPMPLWISSRISSAPCSVHSRRAACRNAGVPGRMPPSPCIGSRMTAQVSAPCSANSRSSAATSLYGMCVMPAGFGPKPLAYFACPPAVTVKSVRPWKLFSVETTRIFFSPDAIVRVAARELQRGLVRLRTGVGEEDALGERVVDEALGEAQRRLAGQPVRHVPQRARLVGDRADHRRMAVTERGDGDAAGEVDVHACRSGPRRASLRRAPERTAQARSTAPSIRRTSRASPAASRRSTGRRRRRAARWRRRAPACRRRGCSCAGLQVVIRMPRAQPRRPGFRSCTPGLASLASTVARAGVCPCGTHASHTAFIAAKSLMSGR